MKQYKQLVEAHHDFFYSGVTRSIDFRIESLKKLQIAVLQHEKEIQEALRLDLGKPEFESYASEIGIVLDEIRSALKNVRSWSKPRKVRTPLAIFPGKSCIIPEPFGVVLIISPWNYPFQLAMVPLIGAMAAGNCCLIKPSEFAPQTSALVKKIIANTFPSNYVSVVEGDVKAAKKILLEKFDYIFYTGGTNAARSIMESAAKHLTPVTLELGGKSPAIVDRECNVQSAAKRIVWGKFFNTGQTCVAPDYVVVHQSIKRELIDHMVNTLQKFYGDDASQSEDYGRIINAKHFDRLRALMRNGKIVTGGKSSKKDRYIAPTLLDNVEWSDPVMQEEIFGPILPILSYDDLTAVIAKIRQRPKPLSLYLFSTNKQTQEEILNTLQFGGGCINDTLSHFANAKLPFGGIGESGTGQYHGKHSFDLFSHQKAIFKKPKWLDLPIRYPPYKGKLGIVKLILR